MHVHVDRGANNCVIIYCFVFVQEKLPYSDRR